MGDAMGSTSQRSSRLHSEVFNLTKKQKKWQLPTTPVVFGVFVEASRVAVDNWLDRFDVGLLMDSNSGEAVGGSFSQIHEWDFADYLPNQPHYVSAPSRFIKIRLIDLGGVRTELRFTLDPGEFKDKVERDDEGKRRIVTAPWNDDEKQRAFRDACALLERIAMTWPESRSGIAWELTRVQRQTGVDPKSLPYLGQVTPLEPRGRSSEQVIDELLRDIDKHCERDIEKLRAALPKGARARERLRSLYLIVAPLHAQNWTMEKMSDHVRIAYKDLPCGEDRIRLALDAGEQGLLEDP